MSTVAARDDNPIDNAEAQTDDNQLLARIEQIEQELKHERQARRRDRHALARENHELRKENEDLKDEFHTYRDAAQTKFERIEDTTEIHESRLDSLSDGVDRLEENGGASSGPEPGMQDGETTMQDDEDTPTPLETVVNLPGNIASRELTANQKRAKFIAGGIKDYVTKVPAGYSFTSTDINTILRARDGKKPHTETVSRVISFLDRFGKDELRVEKHRGKRHIILTEELVERLSQITPPPYHDDPASVSVDVTRSQVCVMENRASG